MGVGVPPSVPGRCLNLQFVDLTDCVRLMDAGLHLIAKNSPHLRQLYLRRCINITGRKMRFQTEEKKIYRYSLMVVVPYPFFAGARSKLTHFFFIVKCLSIWWLESRTFAQSLSCVVCPLGIMMWLYAKRDSHLFTFKSWWCSYIRYLSQM